MATLAVIAFAEEPNALDIDAHAGSVAATVSGDEFLNAGTTGFWVKNTGGASRTVTFQAAHDCNYGVEHDAAVAVADGFTGFIATRFNAQRFNDDNGRVQVTYSAVTGLVVAAVRLA